MEDIDLNLDDFVARVNSDLVGKYVNIASRCAGFITKRFDGQLSLPERIFEFGAERFGLNTGTLFTEFQGKSPLVAQCYDQREYGKALREVMALADAANQYVDQVKPWEIAKDPANDQRLQWVCSIGVNLFRILTIYLKPVLPEVAHKVEQFLGVSPLEWRDASTLLPNGHRISPYQHLMTRVDAKQVAALVEANQESLKPAAVSHSPQRHAQHQENVVSENAQPAAAPAAAPVAATTTPTISIDDFMKIDLRVARVVDAQHVEGAEKLVKLVLDIGTEQRQVFAGIKAHYEPEKLKGRMVVIVANLAPRKMRFGESQGMVLAASNEGSGVFLLDLDSGAEPGMRVK